MVKLFHFRIRIPRGFRTVSPNPLYRTAAEQILGGQQKYSRPGKPWEKPWEITIFMWENHGKIVIYMEKYGKYWKITML